MLRISEPDKAQVRRIEGLFRKLPRQLKNDLRKAQRSALTPIWREEMKAKSGVTAQHSTIFKSGSRTKAGAPVKLVAGASSRKMSGGGTPAELARPWEFGTNNRDALTKYFRTSPKGRKHTVTRRARAQVPAYRRSGWVVYPAAAKAIPRIASLHVQTIMRKIHEAAEGKG